MPSAAITPFWHRLPDIARYPLRGGALAALVVLSAALGLFGGIFLIGLLIWLAVFKYAFEILQSSADGHPSAPEVLSSDTDNGLVLRYLGLQILTFLIPIIIALLTGPLLGLIAFGLAVIIQPAAIMGLAMTGSLQHALAPGLWSEIIVRVGWPYLALFGLLLVIQLSAANGSELLASFLPASISRFVVSVLSVWSLFATFHLMGYLIYQYHEVLGYEPSTHARQALQPFNRDAGLLEQAESRIQAGELEAARVLLAEEIRSRAVGIEAQQLYRRVLRQLDRRQDLLAHGRTLVHLLMEEKNPKDALEVLRECAELDPGFSPVLVEHAVELARRAALRGQRPLAVRLLNAAIEQSPRDPQRVRWALQAVELMTREAGREGEARALLQRVRGGCEDPEQLQRIDAQLAAIPG